MTVGLKVGSIIDEIGASSFLNGFFSTVTALLEGGLGGVDFLFFPSKCIKALWWQKMFPD